MPRLSPQHVNTTRTFVIWATRAAAIVLITAGSYLLVKRVLFGLGSGVNPLEMIFRVWEDTGEGQSTYRGLSALLVGAALGMASRRLARWVVSVPEEGCPRCGYAGVVTDTCPECGQRDMPVG